MKATPEQLANTQPEALREMLQRMPATIADAIGGLSEVAGHYIAAAYFTDTGEMDEPDSSADMAPAAVLKALADCAAFMHRVGSQTLIAYDAAEPDDEVIVTVKEL